MRRALAMCAVLGAVLEARAVPLAEPEPGETSPAAPRWARGLPTEGQTSHRWLLLTFDDGPRPDTTAAIGRTLLAAHVPAVFFVNGIQMVGPTNYARGNREVVAQLAQAGFTIGNHGLRHAHLGPLLASQTAEEIVGNEEVVRQVTGQVPWLFRPPYGSLSLLGRDLCEARGLTQVGWNLGAADFIEQSPRGIVLTIRNKLTAREAQGLGGGIVMLHDSHPWTVEALPLLIDWVRQRNCELLASGEELYEFVDFDRFFVPRGRHAGPLGVVDLFPADEPAREQTAAWQRRVREEARRLCSAP